GNALFNGSLGGREIELHITAEEMIGVEAAENKISIGDRRLNTAATVTGWAGYRASAARPDPQGIAFRKPRDRAATGADLKDIDHRNLDRQGTIISADQCAA